MNKLIKALAEQSGFHFYNMHDVNGQDLGETVEADSWDAVETFTRLVVRECVETLKMGNDVILILVNGWTHQTTR